MFKRKPVAKAMRREEFLRLQFEARGEGGERTHARYADESTKDDGFKGDPDQLAKLKEGVEAWNAWRKENPDAMIDLRGADFWEANLSGANLWDANLSGADLSAAKLLAANLNGAILSGAKAWKANLSGADLRRANLSGANLWDANLSGANLRDANLSGADLGDANLSGANLWDANLSDAEAVKSNLSGADLRRANLSGANLRDANLSGADLSVAKLLAANLNGANLSGADLSVAKLLAANLNGANLSGASLWLANLSGANLRHANLSGANLGLADFANAIVSSIRYRRPLLRNRCHGARVSECYGDAQFRRDVMDQDILDQRISQIRNSAAGEADSPRWWLSALVNGIKSLPILAGLVAGLLLKAMIFPVDAASMFARLAEGHYTDILSFWPFVAGGIGVAVFLAGTLGRLFGYWVWSLFDFGRDWDRVILFAFVMVLAFGGLYAHLDAAHQVALNWPEGDDKVWFYPWFTALMGFATLGIADFVTPITNLGAVVIMANVLSGFVTLGLLLSVLGDGFARRS